MGLPAGQFVTLEVGHKEFGVGRILYQDSTCIHKEIHEQQFFSNPALTEAVKPPINDKPMCISWDCYPMGFICIKIILSRWELALQQGAKQVFIHTFLTVDDVTSKKCGQLCCTPETRLPRLMSESHEGTAYLVSLIGRYFAMDRINVGIGTASV